MILRHALIGVADAEIGAFERVLALVMAGPQRRRQLLHLSNNDVGAEDDLARNRHGDGRLHLRLSQLSEILLQSLRIPDSNDLEAGALIKAEEKNPSPRVGEGRERLIQPLWGSSSRRLDLEIVCLTSVSLQVRNESQKFTTAHDEPPGHA